MSHTLWVVSSFGFDYKQHHLQLKPFLYFFNEKQPLPPKFPYPLRTVSQTPTYTKILKTPHIHIASDFPTSCWGGAGPIKQTQTPPKIPDHCNSTPHVYPWTWGPGLVRIWTQKDGPYLGGVQRGALRYDLAEGTEHALKQRLIIGTYRIIADYIYITHRLQYGIHTLTIGMASCFWL